MFGAQVGDGIEAEHPTERKSILRREALHPHVARFGQILARDRPGGSLDEDALIGLVGLVVAAERRKVQHRAFVKHFRVEADTLSIDDLGNEGQRRRSIRQLHRLRHVDDRRLEAPQIASIDVHVQGEAVRRVDRPSSCRSLLAASRRYDPTSASLPCAP